MKTRHAYGLHEFAAEQPEAALIIAMLQEAMEAGDVAWLQSPIALYWFDLIAPATIDPLSLRAYAVNVAKRRCAGGDPAHRQEGGDGSGVR